MDLVATGIGVADRDQVAAIGGEGQRLVDGGRLGTGNGVDRGLVGDGSGLITITQESDEGDVVIGSSCDEDLAVGQGGDGVSVVVASEADRGLATDTEGGVEDAVVGESHDDKVLIDTVV